MSATGRAESQQCRNGQLIPITAELETEHVTRDSGTLQGEVAPQQPSLMLLSRVHDEYKLEKRLGFWGKRSNVISVKPDPNATGLEGVR